MALTRKFLDLSAAHLTPQDAAYLEECAWPSREGVLCMRYEHGFFVYAQHDLDCYGEELSGNLRRAMTKACELGCDYLMFDQDAEPQEGLPVFDAETGQETTWEALQAA